MGNKVIMKNRKMKKTKKKCECKKPCTKCKCKVDKVDKVEGVVKRGRGRPKKMKCTGDYGTISYKIKNKKDKKDKKSPTECKVGVTGEKRGRGRPKKVRAIEEDIIVVPTKTFKFLGYCPACKLQIVDGDLLHIGGDHVVCPGCNKDMKVKDLSKTIDIDRPKTKKEYFQSINSSYTWHDYSASSDIKSVAKKEEILLTDIEDEHINTDEDDIISKKVSLDD
jgi:hypothetical protein